MSNKRLKKIAKDINNQPKLKKKIATFLAKRALEERKYDIEQMLLTGHRGFMAMNEKELTTLFDTKHEQLEKEAKKMKELIEEYKNTPGYSAKHAVSSCEQSLEIINNRLQEANKIYDEVFEEIFL